MMVWVAGICGAVVVYRAATKVTCNYVTAIFGRMIIGPMFKLITQFDLENLKKKICYNNIFFLI